MGSRHRSCSEAKQRATGAGLTMLGQCPAPARRARRIFLRLLARHLPRVRRGDGWDTLADIEVFVFAVEAELEAMERERVGVHRRGRKPDLTLRRRLIGLIWTLTFGGMQWRVAGWLSGVPFTTLH